jgi:membrane protein implicated in regulation of membrane protease activity
VYVGVAAAITALLAALGLPFTLQLVVFVPLTLALLTLVRPRSLALLHGHSQPRTLSAHSKMVDRTAYVESEVSNDRGLVRLGTGEFWTARAYPPGTVIPKGSSVRIMFVDGLTVHVSLPTDSGTLPDLSPDSATNLEE